MLKLNFIGKVLDYTKNELSGGSWEFAVRIGINEKYTIGTGEEKNRNTLVYLKMYRKAENAQDFETSFRCAKDVYCTCEQPDVAFGKNAKDGALYGYFVSQKVSQFAIVGEAHHFVKMQAVGNLTADAFVSSLKSDTNRRVINFSVACNDRQGDKCVFVSGGMFRTEDKLGVAQFLTKGKTVYVDGIPMVKTVINSSGQERAFFNAEFTNVEFVGSSKREEPARENASHPTRGYEENDTFA